VSWHLGVVDMIGVIIRLDRLPCYPLFEIPKIHTFI